MKLKNIFINTNQQKILNFLALNPDKEFFESEIVKKTKLSAGSVNQVLKNLQKLNLIDVNGRKKQKTYSVDFNNPIIKLLKVLHNIIKITPLINKISQKSEKIILFGSRAEGINLEESDIDLFVLTYLLKEVHQIVNSDPLAEHVQLITKKPSDLIEFKNKNLVFWEQIEKGIVLYKR